MKNLKSNVLFGLILMSTGCGDDHANTDSPRIDEILTLTGNATNGQVVYEVSCQGCHGVDTNGGQGGPSLDHGREHSAKSNVATILEGQGNMPAFDSLTNQEIADVVSWIRS